MFDSDSAVSEFYVTSLLGGRQRTILSFLAVKLQLPNAHFKNLDSRNLLELKQVETGLLVYGF